MQKPFKGVFHAPYMHQKRDWTLTISKILFWLGIAMILGWAIGKSIGWIYSPVWVQMIPIFGGAVSLISIGTSIGKFMEFFNQFGKIWRH